MKRCYWIPRTSIFCFQKLYCKHRQLQIIKSLLEEHLKKIFIYVFGYVCRCIRRFGGQKAASSRPPSGELGLQVVVNFRFYCLKLNSGLLQEQCTLLTLEERASEHLEQVCLDVGRVPICIPAFQKPMQEDCYKSQASQRTPFLKTSSSDNRQANKTAANPNKPRTNVAAQPFQKVECLLSSTSL